MRLLHTGRLRRTRRDAPTVDFLLELGWARQTPRRDEVELCGRADVEARLTCQWPGWRIALTQLDAADDPLTAKGLRALRDRARVAEVEGTALPRAANRRSLAAHLSPHSKVPLSEAQRAAFPELQVTVDGVLRFRPPAGVQVRVHGREVDPEVLGEVIVPERALGGVELSAPPRAVLSVENLGAYVDLPPTPGLLLVYVPGWDTRLARAFLARVEAPRHHFGDLDPAGLAILRHLRAELGPVEWFLPAFWAEHFDRARPLEAPWAPGPLPSLLEPLRATGCWSEQEVLLFDERLPAALADL